MILKNNISSYLWNKISSKLYAFAIFSVLCVGQVNAEFVASFENSIDADSASGNTKCVYGSPTLVESKFGKSLFIAGNGAIYHANKNISLKKGTVSFDYAPNWNGNDSTSHVIFAIYTGNKSQYLQISKLGKNPQNPNCLGGAFVDNGNNIIIADIRGKRFDITDWKSGEFHKIELAWNENNFYFRVDGKDISSGAKTNLNIDLDDKARLVFGESATGLYDNIKISDECEFSFDATLPKAMRMSDKDVVYLSDVAPAKVYSPIRYGKDEFLTSAGKLPLSLRNHIYAKAVVMHAPNRAEYFLEGKFARFRSVIGINDSAVVRGSVVFQVLGDGRELAKFYRTRSDDSMQLDIDVTGVNKLELICKDGVDDFGDHSMWYDAMLLKEGAKVPEPSIIKIIDPMENIKKNNQTIIADNDYYIYKGNDFQNNKMDILVAKHNIIDAFDPKKSDIFSENIEVENFASKGQFINLGFVLGFNDDIKDLKITISPLINQNKKELNNIKIRYCMRGKESTRYDHPNTKFEITSRFLREFSTLNVKNGEFREFFVNVEVPSESQAGLYSSQIEVLNNGKIIKSIPINLEVLDLELPQSKEKIYGMYYDMNRTAYDDIAFYEEMQDLVDHNVTMIFAGDFLKVHFVNDKNNKLQPCLDKMEKGLDRLAKSNFKGKIVISCELGEIIDAFYDIQGNAGRAQAAKAALGNSEYMQLAKNTMLKIKELQKKYPNYEFIITTMDEVFNHGRLPVFITGVKAAQQVDGFSYYATFHFLDEQADRMREEIAPYIQYRNHHMLSWEWYLARGNTFEEYAKELTKYNSVAGAYYNPVGSTYTPAWFRLIMGLEMFDSPLTFQMPWTYYSAFASPYTWPSTHASHIFGFYSHEDEAMVSTRIWEAYREGADDIRYFEALKNAIGENANIAMTQEAKEFYEGIINSIPKAQGLEHGAKLRGDKHECPWTGLLSTVYDNAKLQEIRRKCAYYIMKYNTFSQKK